MFSKKLKRPKRNLNLKNKAKVVFIKEGFKKIRFIGIILILVALIIPIKTYWPVLKAEVTYQVSKKNPKLASHEPAELVEPTPVNPEFSIIIPKINANARVIRNVNPYEPKDYQKALTQGVAHASGTATPDQNGNVFIFAHSATNWYQANQYNAIFYLLNKLEKGDIITLYFENNPYNYSVDEIKFVKPDEISYLSTKQNTNQLTLMTCWPPGTTLKRLVVIATKK